VVVWPICKKCGEIFEYEKRYSYVRKFCNKCNKQLKAVSIIKNHNLVVDYSGDKNPNYKGLIKSSCLVCSKEMLLVPALIKCRKTCSRECNKVWCSWKIGGEHNPKYIDGRCNNDYGGGFKRTLKEQIRDRDKRTCQNCDMDELQHKQLTKQSLVVHHIDYNKKNNNEHNLISLCVFCHNGICNVNKDKFLSIYKEKITQKYLEVER